MPVIPSLYDRYLEGLKRVYHYYGTFARNPLRTKSYSGEPQTREQFYELTVRDVNKLMKCMIGIPVRIEHEHMTVGQVVDVGWSKDGKRARCHIAFFSDDVGDRVIKRIHSGNMTGLSLHHDRTNMTPLELSVCAAPARAGCYITKVPTSPTAVKAIQSSEEIRRLHPDIVRLDAMDAATSDQSAGPRPDDEDDADFNVVMPCDLMDDDAPPPSANLTFDAGAAVGADLTRRLDFRGTVAAMADSSSLQNSSLSAAMVQASTSSSTVSTQSISTASGSTSTTTHTEQKMCDVQMKGQNYIVTPEEQPRLSAPVMSSVPDTVAAGMVRIPMDVALQQAGVPTHMQPVQYQQTLQQQQHQQQLQQQLMQPQFQPQQAQQQQQLQQPQQPVQQPTATNQTPSKSSSFEQHKFKKGHKKDDMDVDDKNSGTEDEGDSGKTGDEVGQKRHRRLVDPARRLAKIAKSRGPFDSTAKDRLSKIARQIRHDYKRTSAMEKDLHNAQQNLQRLQADQFNVFDRFVSSFSGKHLDKDARKAFHEFAAVPAAQSFLAPLVAASNRVHHRTSPSTKKATKTTIKASKKSHRRHMESDSDSSGVDEDVDTSIAPSADEMEHSSPDGDAEASSDSSYSSAESGSDSDDDPEEEKPRNMHKKSSSSHGSKKSKHSRDSHDDQRRREKARRAARRHLKDSGNKSAKHVPVAPVAPPSAGMVPIPTTVAAPGTVPASKGFPFVSARDLVIPQQASVSTSSMSIGDKHDSQVYAYLRNAAAMASEPVPAQRETPMPPTVAASRGKSSKHSSSYSSKRTSEEAPDPQSQSARMGWHALDMPVSRARVYDPSLVGKDI